MTNGGDMKATKDAVQLQQGTVHPKGPADPANQLSDKWSSTGHYDDSTAWPSIQTDMNAARLEELTVESRSFKTRDFPLYWTSFRNVDSQDEEKRGYRKVRAHKYTYIHYTHSYTYIHTHTHTYTHTHTHTHIHTHKHTYIHTHTYTHTHINTHTYTRTHIHTNIYTRTHIHTHIHALIHANTYTHILTHTH